MDVINMIVHEHVSIKNALEFLNRNGLGILFVTDNNSKLLGVITDGDIRRSLLNNCDISNPVQKIMNRKFVSLPIDSDNSLILSKIDNIIKVIPLVDKDNILIDYATINRLRRIPVASPLLSGNELTYVMECISTNWISSQGKFVREFERLFSSYHEDYHSLAVSNGTVALHLALEALGIKAGDEVLVPDLTFAASVNAILYTGAIPVLIDIEPDSWNINIELLEKYLTHKTKAIMPVHLYGHPCEMSSIVKFAQKNNLFIIEDCAEALGSYYQGKPVGTFGDVATFSFYGNKTITTGEGGMVVFKSKKVAELASTLRDHGMDKNKRYWHAQVGYNYRLTNLQAAIGVAQFERLAEFVASKRRTAIRYNEMLSKYNYFQIPAERENCINSYWLYTFLVKESAPFSREELMEYLHLKGIETRPVFFPMHIMPPYISYGNSNDFRISNRISKQGMSLPSSVNLTDFEINHICNEVAGFCSKYNK